MSVYDELAIICIFSGIGLAAIMYDPSPDMVCAIVVLTIMLWAVL